MRVSALFQAPALAEKLEVKKWWNARTFFFNLVLLPIGILTWLSVLIAGSAAVKPGVDFEEPLAMIVGPPIYAVLANLCFRLGPLLDTTFFIHRPRVWLFRAGLLFSMILTAAPGLWAIAAWLWTVHTGQKLD